MVSYNIGCRRFGWSETATFLLSRIFRATPRPKVGGCQKHWLQQNLVVATAVVIVVFRQGGRAVWYNRGAQWHPAFTVLLHVEVDGFAKVLSWTSDAGVGQR